MRDKYPYNMKHLITSLLLALALPLSAGNVPQYQFTMGTNVYDEFTDGTAVPFTWTDGEYGLFPDQKPQPNSASFAGFPIGFTYHYAGQDFTSFSITNQGAVTFGRDLVGWGGSFTVQCSLIMHGLKKGDISYKTTGEEGQHVLSVQWKDATVRESGGYIGKYGLQLRFYEADGRVEIALKEKETVGNAGNGFAVSLRGWNSRDGLLLYGKGLTKDVAISTSPKVDMLDAASYIHWDDNDYDHQYAPVYTFTPVSDATHPATAPQSLTLTEQSGDLIVSCERAEGAPATALFYSTEPFTDNDRPADGTTFAAPSQKTFGHALPLYYDNEEHITATLRGVLPATTYYVRAYAVSGYPAYGAYADATLLTSQPAPTAFTATATDTTAVAIAVEADYPVLIAATRQKAAGYEAGYKGLFGTPTGAEQVGDMITGGGEVIYVGAAGNFEATVAPNALTYFRAWTVLDGRLSTTYADTAAVALPSLPYAPALESYPLLTPLMGWQTTEDDFQPVQRDFSHDLALRAVSIEGSTATLTSPALPLTDSVRLTFLYALETARPLAQAAGGIQLPQGNMPGLFGQGALTVALGGTTQASIREYHGRMTPSGDGYETGSSTYDTVQVVLRLHPTPARIAAAPTDNTLTISVTTDPTQSSILYLKELTIEPLQPDTPTGIQNSECKMQNAAVYDLTGRRVMKPSRGLYIQDGRKVFFNVN